MSKTREKHKKILDELSSDGKDISDLKDIFDNISDDRIKDMDEDLEKYEEIKKFFYGQPYFLVNSFLHYFNIVHKIDLLNPNKDFPRRILCFYNGICIDRDIAPLDKNTEVKFLTVFSDILTEDMKNLFYKFKKNNIFL